MRSPFWKLLAPALTGAALLGLWYGIVLRLPEEQAFLLPTPGDIANALVAQWPLLGPALWQTWIGASLGLLAAVGVSSVLALALARSVWIRAGFYPYLLALQMTPIIVLAPIILLWVGPGLPSVVIITFLLSFFPLVVNATQGLLATDPQLLELFRLYRARPWQELFLLRVPAGAPYFFAGLKIAATLAPIGAIVGDFYAGNSSGGSGGLGFQALVFSSQFKMAALFATAALSCLLGFVFSGAATLFSRWALRRLRFPLA